MNDKIKEQVWIEQYELRTKGKGGCDGWWIVLIVYGIKKHTILDGIKTRVRIDALCMIIVQKNTVHLQT